MSFSRQDGPKSPGRKDAREYFLVAKEREDKRNRKEKEMRLKETRNWRDDEQRCIQVDLSRPSPPPSTENLACVIEALLQFTRRHCFRFDLNGCRTRI